MTFSVVWSVFALQELARIGRAADDPDRVRTAVARMEFALRRMGRVLGESRDPGFRIWYEDVLGVFYRIDETALRIEILYVGPSRRH